MTLEEKVGQIMMVFFEGSTLSENLRKFVAELKVGGVILYSSRNNIESVGQVAELNWAIQQTARDAGSPPLFISIDQEGGLVNRIREGVTLFPGNMALGAIGDPSLAGRVAAVMGEELASLGINVNFAPVVDVNNNPMNPIIGVRSFGSAPRAVARLGSAMISSFMEKGVLPAAKHFPGHGDTAVDSHTGLPLIPASKNRLEEVEFPPFQAAIDAGVPMVMTAHVLVPSLDEKNPATLSSSILGMLRSEMGFKGLIITDSMGMAALKKERTMEEAAIGAFNAGADILLFGADKGHEETEHFGIYSALLDSCRRGKISADRLDESVGRILAAKETLGLFGRNWRPAFSPCLSPDGSATAREAALRSITVARNRRDILQTVRDGKKRPLLWPRERIAAGTVFAEFFPSVDLIEVPEKPEERDMADALRRTGDADRVLIADYDSGRNPEWLELVRKVGEDRTLLLSLRTPYALLSLPSVAGAVISYSDNIPSLQALADVLGGRAPAKGTLPVELPGFRTTQGGRLNP
ncbi:MAG: glycoside hydrolase family 3 protein [Synergistaceae bacterium]|nr:glycoside hydrolase family 3 protein [Synergistaceae bacterium]